MLPAVVAALCLLPAWAGDTTTIGQDVLAEKMSAGADLLILDVRSPGEYAEGHVPGALNIPHDQLESRLAELAGDEDAEVVVYCRSGRRAGIALDLLSKAGFGRLYYLEGDFPGWSAAGRPVERPAGPPLTPPVRDAAAPPTP